MDETDACNALRELLEKRCPGSNFRNNDIKALACEGYYSKLGNHPGN